MSILSITGTAPPSDRPIDGPDLTAVFRQPRDAESPRQGFPFYIKDELRAIKWKD
jgi:arylsulfatase